MSEEIMLFDNWTDLVKRAEFGQCVSRQQSSHQYSGDFSWDYGVGFAGALRLAKNGWPEGLAKVKQLSDVFYGGTLSLVKSQAMVNDVQGHSVDIPAYIAGEPECMLEWEDEEWNYGAVKIVINAVTSAGISASRIFAKGAAVCALVDALEMTGKRCEVVLCMSVNSRYDGGYFEYRCVVKHLEDPLQIDQLAFAIAHPASFRRLGFRLYEVMDDAGLSNSLTSNAYGRVVDTKLDRGDIYLAGSHLDYGNWEDNAWVVQWILGQLTAQGVEL